MGSNVMPHRQQWLPAYREQGISVALSAIFVVFSA
jgi:hypothetical protein